ncbi:MAG: preprotein translocase subunit SecA, partial [Parcubacteria group bacterium Greene0416_79]
FKAIEKKLKPFYPLVERINALEEKVKELPSEAFKERTTELKARLQQRETLDALLPEAFAQAREAARRTLGERHFDVQLLGGMVLHRRGIAEMRTGEGKTLVATLPAYLNALTGKGVHVVTVNDYLSRRDAVWMGQVYGLLGLSVGVINHDSSFIYDASHVSINTGQGGRISNSPNSPNSLISNKISNSNVQNPKSEENLRLKTDNLKLDAERDLLGGFKVVHEFLRPCTRREAYAADITYGTNNEFGFDYLRDNLEYAPEGLRQRGFPYAIIDEVDSILIDEARTPLIISAPTQESENLYGTFARIAAGFAKDVDFTVDEKLHAIQLTPSGISKAERALGVPNLYTEGGIKYVHHLETAVRAKALFHRDKHYVVREGEAVIVDEFTGRLQPGRRWSEGLHQAIEAKEGVAVQKESRTMASITFQNYFRMYGKLSGMTGTAKTSSEEFYKVYGLDVVSIPTNKPSQRTDRNDLIFQTEVGKFKAITRTVGELHKRGQPVLIGTVSIEKNEILSEFLRAAGIPHEVLNAKNHEREGAIIAQAGRRGAVTVATNMAGRGVDIKLGGNPAAAEAYEEVKAQGGLFVLGTERHEARRIDNQLRGRSARQGDPGGTAFFVSLEDTLMRVFASDTIKRMMGRFGIPEDEPIENRIITKSLETAQTKIEGFNFDARKHVLEYDDVLNHQRKTIYERRRNILLGGSDAVDEYFKGLGSSEVQRRGSASTKMVEAETRRGSRQSAHSFTEEVEKKKKQLGENFSPICQRLILQSTDLFWVEHLEVMDYLRSSVNLRAYGQRDPLVEYKREGLRMFKEMEQGIANQIMTILPELGGQIAAAPRARLQEVHEQAQLIGSGDEESDRTHHGNSAGGGSTLAREKVRTSTGEKIGRNDPCYCGSGKKYKRCHGA